MKFRWKVFTSLTLTLNFFLASVSGIALFLTPRGRIANWTNWTFLGLEKDGWEAVHISSITLMLVFGLLHLFWFNWKPFLGYLGKRLGKGLRYPLEISITVILFLIIFFGTLYEVPGVMAVANLRDTIKDSYELQKDQPPVPHAEELTLKQFSKKILDRPVEEVLAELKELGWNTSNHDILLSDLAAEYGISPKKIMNTLQGEKQEGKGSPNDSGSGSHGYGYGRMTLEEICTNNGLQVSGALAKLQSLGVKNVDKSTKVKQIADKLGIKPNQVVEKLKD